MNKKKFCFIDRDGTLILEPEDKQVDAIEKVALMTNVILALRQLQDAGFSLVMVSNQDGLGTDSFPQKNFDEPHNFLLQLLKSQGIQFEDIRICPHLPVDDCFCRKPRIGLLQDYCVNQEIDKDNSYVIGDRETDLQLAKNLNINGLRITNDWTPILEQILDSNKTVSVRRKTNETDISISLSRKITASQINTGLGFFDHMLEQLIKHSGLSAVIDVKGDLYIDDHHTVEDTAITLGQALKKLINDKRGLQRYGFLLPMDESLAQVAIDLSGRACCMFNAEFQRQEIGGLSMECVIHFFESLAQSLEAAIHIKLEGKNTHHMVEAAFKGVGRALKQALRQQGNDLPTTKGVL